MLAPRRALCFLSLVVLASGQAGCASRGPGGDAASGDAARRVRPSVPSRESIGITELAPMRERSVYEAIQHLRPSFLRGRGFHAGPGSLAVYLDGLHFGGIETLHTLRASGVREIRYLSAIDATQRYGGHHGGGGAILVVTASGR